MTEVNPRVIVIAGAKSQAMNSPNTAEASNDAGLAALAALKRAGLRAAQEALRTNTYMVVAENGKVERLSPQEYLREREDARKKQSGDAG